MTARPAHDIRFDPYGAPIFHEIDGIRYWGREGEAQALGMPLQEMDWTDEKISIVRRAAFQKQERAKHLMDAAERLKIDAHQRPTDRGFQR